MPDWFDKLVAKRKDQLEKNRSFPNPQGQYAYVRYKYVDSIGQEQRYNVSGDTVYCAEINSFQPVYIKFAQRQNPWIRLQERNTYKRLFNQFWIRGFEATIPSGLPSGLARAADDVILYASTGDLVIDAGIRRLFPTFCFRDGVAPGGAAACTDWLNSSFIWSNGAFDVRTTLGKSAGRARIKNQEAAGGSDLLFGFGTTFTAVSHYPIAPGESIEFDIDTRLGLPYELAGPIPNLYSVHSSGAANVSYAVMLFCHEFDGADLVFRGNLVGS